MTQTEKDTLAYEQMASGRISATGFLGKDTRALSEIIQEDLKSMQACDLSFSHVAETLIRFRNEAAKGFGNFVKADKNIIVKSGDARGYLPCPWNDGFFSKNLVEAVNEKTGAKIVFSDLSIHLLKEHHFCQGKGSEYRLDPVVLKKLLEN